MHESWVFYDGRERLTDIYYVGKMGNLIMFCFGKDLIWWADVDHLIVEFVWWKCYTVVLLRWQYFGFWQHLCRTCLLVIWTKVHKTSNEIQQLLNTYVTHSYNTQGTSAIVALGREYCSLLFYTKKHTSIYPNFQRYDFLHSRTFKCYRCSMWEISVKVYILQRWMWKKIH